MASVNITTDDLRQIVDYYRENQMLDTTFYDEDTLFKVREALQNSLGYSDQGVDALLNTLQNAGILFRERPSHVGDQQAMSENTEAGIREDVHRVVVAMEEQARDRALRHNAMEWAAATANGTFLDPSLVIDRAEEFIAYVNYGVDGGKDVNLSDETDIRQHDGEFIGSGNHDNYSHKARRLVFAHILATYGQDEKYSGVGFEDVYVVWFCKTLQNWKALISTTIEDGFYYEVTYDGDRQQTYIDRYSKVTNTTVED